MAGHTTNALLVSITKLKTHATNALLTSTAILRTHTTNALIKSDDKFKNHTTNALLLGNVNTFTGSGTIRFKIEMAGSVGSTLKPSPDHTNYDVRKINHDLLRLHGWGGIDSDKIFEPPIVSQNTQLVQSTNSEEEKAKALRAALNAEARRMSRINNNQQSNLESIVEDIKIEPILPRVRTSFSVGLRNRKRLH